MVEQGIIPDLSNANGHERYASGMPMSDAPYPKDVAGYVDYICGQVEYLVEVGGMGVEVYAEVIGRQGREEVLLLHGQLEKNQWGKSLVHEVDVFIRNENTHAFSRNGHAPSVNIATCRPLNGRR